MAQHYKLSEEKEPKIFRSVRRLAEYYVRASSYILKFKQDFCKETIYRKEVIKLPDTYKLDKQEYIVLKIGKYSLEDSSWWNENELAANLSPMYSNLFLECHIDELGNVMSIYMVL